MTQSAPLTWRFIFTLPAQNRLSRTLGLKNSVLTLLACLGLMLSLGSVGCGLNLGTTSGTSSSPNDVRPTTPVVKQGQFFAAGGQTGVTGSVVIFFNSGQSYTVRLEGLSVPSETGLKVVVTGTVGEIQRFSLRASTGNQNYTLTFPNPIFTSVSIFSTSANTNYANAQLL